MITGEIAILFASAAGIGAAAATWVSDCRLAKRLTDLKARIDDFDDALAKTEAAITALRRVSNREIPKDLYAKVADDIRTDVAKTKALGVRLDGKSPDLAALYQAPPAIGPVAKHPLYAKTGLPNQPVASLRPTPARRCSVCCYTGQWPGSQPCPNCGD
jgi:hypothetical protein